MRSRASLESAGPVTWCTVAVPEVEQVPGGQPRPGHLVDADSAGSTSAPALWTVISGTGEDTVCSASKASS